MQQHLAELRPRSHASVGFLRLIQWVYRVEHWVQNSPVGEREHMLQVEAIAAHTAEETQLPRIEMPDVHRAAAACGRAAGDQPSVARQ